MKISKAHHDEAHFKIEHFTVSVLLFIAAGGLGYVLSPIIGSHWFQDNWLNKVFTTDTLASDLAKGNLDHLMMGVVYGVIAILIYQSIRWAVKKYHLLHMTHILIVMSTSFWASVAIVIIYVWHEFVLSTEQHTTTENFFNSEFFLIFIGLVVLFFGLMFNAGFEHRIAALVKKEPDYDKEKSGPEA